MYVSNCVQFIPCWAPRCPYPIPRPVSHPILLLICSARTPLRSSPSLNLHVPPSTSPGSCSTPSTSHRSSWQLRGHTVSRLIPPPLRFSERVHIQDRVLCARYVGLITILNVCVRGESKKFNGRSRAQVRCSRSQASCNTCRAPSSRVSASGSHNENRHAEPKRACPTHVSLVASLYSYHNDGQLCLPTRRELPFLVSVHDNVLDNSDDDKADKAPITVL